MGLSQNRLSVSTNFTVFIDNFFLSGYHCMQKSAYNLDVQKHGTAVLWKFSLLRTFRLPCRICMLQIREENET